MCDNDGQGGHPASSWLPVTVVLGNPPFSALTTSANDWIDGLLRAQSLHGRHVGGFFEVNGVSLGEKKTWLHDDYVKFLRYSQWLIERAGCGVVGLVTNHGYLDNLTFRGVRQSLLNTFSRISAVDLHGNRKKRETDPSGGRDENVFGIDQGVAIGLFCRAPGKSSAAILRADLWGTRDQKLLALRPDAPPLPWQPIDPQSPNYAYPMTIYASGSSIERDPGGTRRATPAGGNFPRHARRLARLAIRGHSFAAACIGPSIGAGFCGPIGWSIGHARKSCGTC
jgi:hypothetical protein